MMRLVRVRRLRNRITMTAGKDGHVIVCDGVDVFSVEGGRVARKDIYLDRAAVQRQVAEPAAAPA
jgi:hypothetical protein